MEHKKYVFLYVVVLTTNTQQTTLSKIDKYGAQKSYTF